MGVGTSQEDDHFKAKDMNSYILYLSRNTKGKLEKECIHQEDEKVKFNNMKLNTLLVGGRYCTRYCPYNLNKDEKALESEKYVDCALGNLFSDYSPQLLLDI